MDSTKFPARRGIEVLSLLIAAVVLSFIYLTISPSSHIPSSLQPKGLSSYTTKITTNITDKTIPFPFGHNHFSPNFSSPTNPHPPHHKRLNPQELYEYYRCYGTRLWDMMQQVYRGEIAPPGRAFTYAELAGAWTRVNEPGAFIPAFEAWSRDTFGRVIGGGEVNATTMKQDKEYVSITGTEEDATNARYEALYIPSAGTIIALNIHSPLNLLMRENAAMGLSPASAATIVPSLHRWTDMAWFLWSDIFARSSSSSPPINPGSSIQYIGHDLITNDDTRYTIEYIVASRNGGDAALGYPGLEFGMEEEEGMALLGTPNGRGTAWVVVDHLGGGVGRRGFRCRVWRVQVGYWVMMWRLDGF